MTANKKASQQPISAHYISGTHWDREWYRPFQEFRVVLVELVDLLLDHMEANPDFKYFHFDGQTCMLQDYLDIRPENRDRLAQLISDGRILIGPWFTMPDLFGPGDEALIRNLLVGRRIAQQWNVEPMNVAYTCDMFGHPSQMPQIYAGFNMNHCVLGRGTNEHTTPAFFNWQAPDGSAVFTYKLEDRWGYGAFCRIRQNADKAEAEKDSDAAEKVRTAFREYVDHEVARSQAPVLCLIDALDHQLPATDAPKYLDLIRETSPNCSTRHSTLPAFFAEAQSQATDLPTRVGELREPSRRFATSYLQLIPHCPSARFRMKQANDAVQNLLEKAAEPLFCVAALEGASIAPGLLDTAWHYLLLNHAHDSICGCSIDQVHRDMMYRYDQARIIGRQIRNKAFAALTADCADLAEKEGEFTVTIANTAPYARREVVTFAIDLPSDYKTEFCDGFEGQQIKAFTLHNADGAEIPYQRLAIDPNQLWRTAVALPATTDDGPCHRYTVAAQLDLPALGFTSVLVKPAQHPVRHMNSLRTGPQTAENEHLAIIIAPNGTLTLTDKATGQTYTNLLTFDDRGETGDGWFYVPPVNDEVILSSAASARVSVIHDGPEQITFRIALTLNVPARYDKHYQRRSNTRVDLPIETDITLRRGARLLDIETRLDNTAEDHVLRLLLPSDAPAQTYLAHHPFDLVERNIQLNAETATWQEAERPEKPFLHCQAVGGEKRGLAFISQAGLHEGGVIDDARRTMMVTLFRSFRRTVNTSGEPGGLERGDMTFRYQIMPYAGKLPRSDVFRQLTLLQSDLFTRQTGPRSSGYPAMTGKQPARRSFCELLDGNLVMAALKPREGADGLTLRLWNPTGQAQTENVRFDRPLKAVAALTLAETPDADAPAPQVDGATLTVTAEAHKIITISLEF